MVVRIGDIEMKMSRVTFAYKCFLLSFVLSTFVFGEVMTFHSRSLGQTAQLPSSQTTP